MPGRRLLTILCIWPGLARICGGRELAGLTQAVAFTALLNSALIATLIFPETVSPLVAVLLWYAVGVSWLWSTVASLWWLWQHHPEHHRTEIEQLFREAIRYYLKGQWADALASVQRILEYDRSDCDALMQLATLYLHTGRPTEAKQAFRQCLEQQSGSKWRWEIDQELQRIGQA